MSRTPAAVLASLLLPAALLAPEAAYAAPEPVTAPAAAPAAAPLASARGTSGTVTIRGHGYGHGRGLSQYGAQKAARAGRSHRAILRFYYPHTRLGRRGGAIRVLLTGDTGNDLVVHHRSGLRLRSLAAHRTWRLRQRGAQQWRIRPSADGSRSVVSYRTRRWHHWRTVAGAAEFFASGPITLLAESGKARYRGALRSAPARRHRDTVNVLPLEQYLRGVVPQEVPALWEPAAVRAQAVAARTYAAFERADHPKRTYHLCDTSLCQVYGGRSAEHPASNAAIRQTRKQVVSKRGRPVFAQFSASSGGWTVDDPDRSYLQARRDRWDAWRGNPYHTWQTSLPAATIEEQWPGIGRLQRIRVLRRDGHGDWNGRILSMRLVGTDGRVGLSGDDFRSRLGLRSTWLRISTDL